MKYGVIYAPTENIGDDIQTLAAINFLKNKGVTKYEIVDREALSEYDGEEINLVMNGWFTHDTNKFLPSDNIKPIWISFHVAKPKIVKCNLEYFKKQPPIGCRDQATVDLLQEYGIEAYFTGCLTLSFDKHVKKGDKKYLVDLNVKPPKEVVRDFETVKHKTFKMGYTDIEKRLQLANEFIARYKEASLVITSRLHCALPCRSFGTDCIFVHKNYETDPRFKGLERVLNGATEYHNNVAPAKDEFEKIKKFFKKYKI